MASYIAIIESAQASNAKDIMATNDEIEELTLQLMLLHERRAAELERQEWLAEQHEKFSAIAEDMLEENAFAQHQHIVHMHIEVKPRERKTRATAHMVTPTVRQLDPKTNPKANAWRRQPPALAGDDTTLPQQVAEIPLKRDRTKTKEAKRFSKKQRASHKFVDY